MTGVFGKISLQSLWTFLKKQDSETILKKCIDKCFNGIPGSNKVQYQSQTEDCQLHSRGSIEKNKTKMKCTP